MLSVSGNCFSRATLLRSPCPEHRRLTGELHYYNPWIHCVLASNWPKGRRGRRWLGGRRVRSLSKTLASCLRAECIPPRKVTAPVTQSSPRFSFWAWASKPAASSHSFKCVGSSNVPPHQCQADTLFLPIFVNTGFPRFLKVHFITTWSLQKTYISTCFSLTQRNPKIFALLKNAEKWK